MFPIKKIQSSAFTRIGALILPVICIVLLLTQVAFAKSTYVINDQGNVVIYTTYASNPAEVLDEAGLELGEDDIYTTQGGIGMSEITVQRKQSISVVCGNSTYVLGSYGETVAALLERTGFQVGDDDRLSVSLTDETFDGMVVHITKTISEEEIYTVNEPFETEYYYDAALAEGEEMVLTEGCDGQIRYTDLVVYVNGKEISRTTQSVTVITRRINRIVAIGSQDISADNDTADLSQQVIAGELTEDTKPIIGDGYIITPDGEVLTYTSSTQMLATAYNNKDAGCTEYTATGTLARVGAVAVDPKVIPYGTRMYIVSNDGKYIYGIAVAEDCGGGIKKNRVDLYFDTVEECFQFGRRNVTIYFLGAEE